MQHKTNKVLSILLALVMVLGLAPAMSVPAQAAENDGGKAIVLGTGVLDGPTEVTDDEDPNKKHYTPNSYVWFGVNGDGRINRPSNGVCWTRRKRTTRRRRG